MEPRLEPRRLTALDAGVRLCLRASAILLSLILFLPASNLAQVDPDTATDFVFHAPHPLGYEALILNPGKRSLYIIGSIESHDLDGIHVYRRQTVSVATRNGERVTRYPDEIVFRVTATTITPDDHLDPPAEIEYPQDVSQLLLSLHFQLKLMRGLRSETLDPYDVRLIGIPSEQPAQERVYRVAFHLQNVPADARLALDVTSSQGERLARFRVEML